MTLTKDNPHRKKRRTIYIDKSLIEEIDDKYPDSSFSRVVNRLIRKGLNYS